MMNCRSCLITPQVATPHDIISDYTEGAGESITEETVDLIWSILDERYDSVSSGSTYIEKKECWSSLQLKIVNKRKQ